jgi:threonyl-tRNA synthetase
MEQENKRYMQVANDLNLLAIGNSAGVIYWKPEGLKLYENLKSFIRKHHEKRGYLEVKSPSIVVDELFEKSGHLEKYKENMFILNSQEEHNYVLRPMSCPNHIVIYESELRSYRNLPLPIFEFGEVFRNEPSGSLQLLFRQRQFCQDDSHVFVNKENLSSAISNYLLMARDVYNQLGFEDVQYDISLRPEKRFGEESDWDVAEESLREACSSHNIKFNELPGEGAFYGPKIELKVKDKLGRSWQLGTLQLDYVLPKRFDLHYINEDGKKDEPIILHHAVLGSLERMIGILLESFGVNLPEFLHPVPSIVIPVSDKSASYAKIVANKISSQVDNSAEPLGKKLEIWRNKGVANIYVVGEKEAIHFNDSGEMKAVLNKGKERSVVSL